MSLKSINLATGKLINKYQEYSDNHVNSIIDDVSNKFLIWKNLTFDERKSILLSIGEKNNH
jgi:acyl-CoA reductase-like NAD-dependent aldehyde dehydrogenase